MKKKGAASAARLACALAAAIVIIAGCHKVTGGGWIAGVNGGKATFGFQAQCVDDEFGDPSQFEGQFQFNDRGAGVRFHGDVNANQTYVGAPEEWSCSDIVELVFPAELNQALFRGECTSPGGITGTFSVEVTDNGTPATALLVWRRQVPTGWNLEVRIPVSALGFEAGAVAVGKG